MAIIFDLILMTLTIFVATYVGVYFLPFNLPMRLILSALITFALTTFIGRILFKPRDNKISYRRFITYLIWQGEGYTKQLLQSLCGNSHSFEDKGDYVLIDGKAVFLWTKYGAISADSLVRFYRISKDNNLISAHILTTNGDKKTSAFIKNFGDIMLAYCNFKQVYKAAKKYDALPTTTRDKIPLRQLLSMIFQTAFTRKNGFRFIGISLLLLLISFVTPFSSYYIVIASVNLIFAITCLIVSMRRE